jgi:hypothetical protein
MPSFDSDKEAMKIPGPSSEVSETAAQGTTGASFMDSEKGAQKTPDRSSFSDTSTLTEADRKHVWRKIDYRILPLVSLLYLLSFLCVP